MGDDLNFSPFPLLPHGARFFQSLRMSFLYICADGLEFKRGFPSYRSEHNKNRSVCKEKLRRLSRCIFSNTWRPPHRFSWLRCFGLLRFSQNGSLSRQNPINFVAACSGNEFGSPPCLGDCVRLRPLGKQLSIRTRSWFTYWHLIRLATTQESMYISRIASMLAYSHDSHDGKHRRKRNTALD